MDICDNSLYIVSGKALRKNIKKISPPTLIKKKIFSKRGHFNQRKEKKAKKISSYIISFRPPKFTITKFWRWKKLLSESLFIKTLSLAINFVYICSHTFSMDVLGRLIHIGEQSEHFWKDSILFHRHPFDGIPTT